MKRKEIAVFAGSRPVNSFLENFFNGKKIYRASYFKDPGPFLKHVNTSSPSVIVAESCLHDLICEETSKLPTLAIISGKIENGIKAAINNNVKQYIYRPYMESDLEYKLQTMIMENDTIRRMGNELRELETVVELNQLISSTLDHKVLLYRIVSKIAAVIPVTRCSIIRVDWLRRTASVVSTYEDPLISDIKLNLRKYPEIVEALTSKKPVVIRDILTDPLMKRVKAVIAPLGIRSILVLPIFFHDKIIGTLFLRTSRAKHMFSDTEIRLLSALANASANALYNAFRFEQVEDEKTRLEKLAITDYLTDIYNIRYFYNRITEEFSRCQRYTLPISCLMIDIDFFKKVNDVYGHRTGDLVLKEFARILKKYSRKSDVLARYGGEEFILLLPQTARDGAMAEAERIRVFIEDHKFRALKDKASLTVSVGISVFPHRKIKSHDDLISFADHALFMAKNRGRNQVAIIED